MNAPALRAESGAVVAAALPPGPRAPLGGSVNLLRFFADPIATMTRLQRRYGDVASLARGDARHVVAIGAAHNRLILSNPRLFHNLDAATMPIKVPAGSALARLFNGLTHMNGARHEQQRRLLAPAFSRRMIEGYLPGIAAEAARMVDTWCVGERRDLAQDMGATSLSIAVRILLGLDPQGNGAGAQRLFRRWVERVFSIGTMALPFDWPGLPFRRLLALSEDLEAEIRAVIAQRRAMPAADYCALTALLAAQDADGAALTDDELVGQTAFLFMATQSTTANALAYTLLMLERHRDVLDAVAAECARIDLAAPTVEQVQSLTLLDGAARETLRLLPPVILWCKVSQAPFDLGPYRLPAGTRIIQSALMTQRDATIYPEPNRFWPERWTRADPDPFQFCAFSAGPRMCLGVSIALLEIKIMVATVLRRFRLALPEGARIDVKGPMLLSPRRGVPIDLHPLGASPPYARLAGNIGALVDFPAHG